MFHDEENAANVQTVVQPRRCFLWVSLSHVHLALISSGSCVVRDASGNLNDKLPVNFSELCEGLGCKLGWNFTICEQGQSCSFGLANNFQVLLFFTSFC